jgi:hypothetical protein
LEGHLKGEETESSARLLRERWYHLSIVRDEKKLKLYVNGILDSMSITEGFTLTN